MDGREPFPNLHVRPIEPNDADRLQAAFRRLSPESVYRRFFTLMPELPASLLQRLVVVDHENREALVALDGDDIVAVARWDRLASDPDEAEIAVTVGDSWQHSGLGKALMRMLGADAVRHGITTLSATVLTDNRPALGFAVRGRPSAVELDGPETHFTFPVAS